MEREVFACQFCPKSFKSRWIKVQHERGHTKPFQCAICERPFSRKVFRDYHRRSCINTSTNSTSSEVDQDSSEELSETVDKQRKRSLVEPEIKCPSVAEMRHGGKEMVNYQRVACLNANGTNNAKRLSLEPKETSGTLRNEKINEKENLQSRDSLVKNKESCDWKGQSKLTNDRTELAECDHGGSLRHTSYMKRHIQIRMLFSSKSNGTFQICP